MKHIFDLRSDTLTIPSKEMKKHMLKAKVGDSYYDEDPSVRCLEIMISELFGKQCALFMPTTTMSNQVAMKLVCNNGDAILTPKTNHIVIAETGPLAGISGIQHIEPELFN